VQLLWSPLGLRGNSVASISECLRLSRWSVHACNICLDQVILLSQFSSGCFDSSGRNVFCCITPSYVRISCLVGVTQIMPVMQSCFNLDRCVSVNTSWARLDRVRWSSVGLCLNLSGRSELEQVRSAKSVDGDRLKKMNLVFLWLELHT
jgi:hypothetical protein